MSLSTKVLFFCFSSLLLLPCQKTLVFRFFSINSQVILKNSRPLASNFSILLSNLLKNISIQVFPTRKQQQLGENKKIRLWSTGNSYSQIETRTYYMSFFTPLWFFISTSQFWSNTFFSEDTVRILRICCLWLSNTKCLRLLLL